MRYVLRPVRQPPEDTDLGRVVGQLGRLVPRLFTLVAGVAALAAAALALAGQFSLAVATFVVAVMVAAVHALSRVWNRLSEAVEPPTPEVLGPAFRGQAAALVTLQGVVLTLVLTLAGDDPSATVKVAAVALVVGVLLGLLQGGLVALGVAGGGQVAIAAILFNLTIWACAYGLLCLAAELVIER